MHADPTACCGVYVGGVSVAAATTLTLGSRFARELPELAVAWQANDLEDARLLVLNEPLATELGLEPAFLRGAEGLRFLTGNVVPTGAEPVAQTFAGHQFSSFSPQLGRRANAATAAKSIDEYGHRPSDDQRIKGSGAPCSPAAATARPRLVRCFAKCLGERVDACAGHPTTRALAVAATGEEVRRETVCAGAVLTRMASSHLRVGTLSVRWRGGRLEHDAQARRYGIARHDPDVRGRAAAVSGLLPRWPGQARSSRSG